jgi:hypothetical protein
VTTISSDTLYVNLVGSNYEIELMDEFSTIAFGSAITVAQYSCNRILATGNFTIDIPTGTNDGGCAYFWITGTTGSPIVTLAAGIKIPSSSTLVSPFTVPNGTKTRFVMQYDATRAAWEVIQYIPGY